MVIVVVVLHCSLVAVEIVVVTANANGEYHTVMEARGKERDVAVQHEAPEFLACSDLNLSGSIVQQIRRPDLPDTIKCAVPECVLHNFRAIGGPGLFEDPEIYYITITDLEIQLPKSPSAAPHRHS